MFHAIRTTHSAGLPVVSNTLVWRVRCSVSGEAEGLLALVAKCQWRAAESYFRQNNI